jgi:thioredoxin 1
MIAGIQAARRCDMSNVLPVTAETFRAEVLESPIPVVVDLYATWCAPCRMLAPVLERLAAELAGRVKFVKVDTDDQPELAEAFNVSSIPMLALMKDGRVLDVSVGLVSPDQIRQMASKALPAVETVGR